MSRRSANDLTTVAPAASGQSLPDQPLLDTTVSGSGPDDSVTDATEVTELVETVQSVHVSDEVRRYVVDLITATRRHPDLRLGASPRATLHLIRTARAAAALEIWMTRPHRRSHIPRSTALTHSYTPRTFTESAKSHCSRVI